MNWLKKRLPGRFIFLYNNSAPADGATKKRKGDVAAGNDKKVKA